MAGMSSTVRFLQEENRRLQKENESLREELSLLRGCLKSLRGLQRAISQLDTRTGLRSLLDRIIYESLRIVDASDGSLILLDRDTNELVFVVVRGVLSDYLQGHRIPADTGIAGWMIANQEPVIVNDITGDVRFSALIDEKFHFRTHSLLGVPLISRGQALGAIEVVNKFSGRPFDERDLEMLSTLAPLAATAIDLMDLATSEE